MDDLARQIAGPDDPLGRALRRIEADLFEPLSLSELAETAGLSAFHFSRAFSARFGQSPMAYVRARRIAVAAARLAGSDAPSLIELAFDCGFDSQEGFTRAFKRAFGVSPGRFRRCAGASLVLMETAMTVSDLTVTVQVEPKPLRKPALRLAGVGARFDAEDKSGIPELWPQLFARLPSAGEGGWRTFGVCWDAGGEAMGYMAAVEWGTESLPPRLEVKEVPEQTYLVFRQVLDGGPLHLQMQAAAREIWGRRLPACGFRLAAGPDLEVYPPGFRPDAPGATVEWWAPVLV